MICSMFLALWLQKEMKHVNTNRNLSQPDKEWNKWEESLSVGNAILQGNIIVQHSIIPEGEECTRNCGYYVMLKLIKTVRYDYKDC